MLKEHYFLEKSVFLFPLALTVYGAYSFYRHWTDINDRYYTDPPLAEFVLLLLGAAGFLIVLREEETGHQISTCLIAVVLTLISFGGWWWTEVMYDLQVIHSVPVLGSAPEVSIE
jgi:hypothetical protein